MPVTKCKLARGSRACSPGEIWNLALLNISGNASFSIYFCIFKVIKRGNKVKRKGALCLSLSKLGEVPPGSPGSFLQYHKNRLSFH